MGCRVLPCSARTQDACAVVFESVLMVCDVGIKRIVIVGAGGQSRELAWYIHDINRQEDTFRIVGCVVSDLTHLKSRDTPVLGDYGWLASHDNEVDALALGLGSPGTRLRVAAELGAAFPKLEWPAIVHPSARYDRDTATIGHGVMIGAGFV